MDTQKQQKISPSFETVGRFAVVTHSFIESSKQLSFHTRWLYVALVYYFNTQSKVAFPSYKTIKELTGLRGEMIAKGIKQLEQEGWIRKKRRFSNSNVYEIVFNKEKIAKHLTEIETDQFSKECSNDSEFRVTKSYGSFS